MSKRLSKKQKASRQLGGYTWFPLDVIDWLTSPDVRDMTAAERGIYITILAVQWRDGHVPAEPKPLATALGLDHRSVANWLRKWDSLVPIVLHKCIGTATEPSHIRCGRANQKLQEIAMEVAKNDLDRHAEEKKEEETRAEPEDVFDGAVDSGSPASPKQEKETDGSTTRGTENPSSEKPPAERLAQHFWNRLGKLSRYSNPETVKAWTLLSTTLLRSDDYDTVASVINWALDESAFWTERIVGATAKGPMEYFAEKYEDIKQRMGAEQKSLQIAKDKAKKVAAAVMNPKPGTHAAEQPQMHTGRRADGGDFFKDSGL